MKKSWNFTPQCTAVFHQYLSAIIGSFSFALVGNAEGWPSPTLLKMRDMETPMILDSSQISWMVSMIYIGHLISPVPSGLLMDRYGRKRAILLLSLPPLFSWILIWLTSSARYLYIARFLVGLWAGAVSTIIPNYIGEIASPKIRGSLTMLTDLMRNLGVLLVYFVGHYVSYTGLAMSCAILTLVFIVSFSFMPESPYYHLMCGKEEKAYESLNWLRGKKGKKVDIELQKMKEAIEQQLMNKGSFKDVWNNKGNRKAFIISEFYSVMKRLTGSGVLQAYVAITLPSLTFGILNPDDCAIFFGLTGLTTSFATVFLAVHFNRRSLMTLSAAGCGLTMMLVSTWFYLNSNTNYDVEPYSDWLFICFIVYNSMFALGLGPIGTSLRGELFAANVKAICSSLTTILVAVTSFVLNKFFLIVAESLGMHVNFIIYAVSCVLTIVFTWVYVPETHGKSLEEIQRVLNGEKIGNKTEKLSKSSVEQY